MSYIQKYKHMKHTAKQIAEILNGQLIGDSGVYVNNLSKIEDGKIGTISFLSNPKYTHFIYTTKASVVIVNKDFIPEHSVSCTLIKVKDSYAAFAQLLDAFDKTKSSKIGISKYAFISDTAKIGKNVYIGEFSFIGKDVIIEDNAKIYPQVYIGDNTIIKANTRLFSGVKIYPDNVIGKNCVIHSGVVIGSDGFGFVPQEDHNYKKIAQIGNVIIEDNVEIGSNTTIDRATLGSTIIRKGVKLDNLIQVAHNVEIGENTVIAAQTGISGSVKIGENCMIGGQVGIAGHLRIADNVKIAAKSGISSSIKKQGEILMGAPAFEVHKYRKSYVLFRNLTELEKRICDIEMRLKNT